MILPQPDSIVRDTMVVKIAQESTASLVLTWLPPLTALVAVFLGPMIQLVIGRRQLKAQSDSLERQLTTQRDSLDRQLTAQREMHRAQLDAQRDAAEGQASMQERQISVQLALATFQYEERVIVANRLRWIDTVRKNVAEYLAVVRWLQRTMQSHDKDVLEQRLDKNERAMSLGYELEMLLHERGPGSADIVELTKELRRQTEPRADVSAEDVRKKMQDLRGRLIPLVNQLLTSETEASLKAPAL